MILRQAKNLKTDDRVRLKHERYPSAIFTVVEVSPSSWEGTLRLKVKLYDNVANYGPTEYLFPDDLVEIILQ